VPIANTEEEIISRSGEEVKANEEGNFNISFDDGYNGYCIDYGYEHAQTGDAFTPADTSHVINKQTGEDVGNYLKVYFVDYFEDAMRNEIVTQHTIWHFTDNFNGWRLDYNLIENIKTTALTKTIPDHGAYKQINNTTAIVFDFEVLKTGNSQNQNFFAYKITYKDINEVLKNETKQPLRKPLGTVMPEIPSSSLKNSTSDEDTLPKNNSENEKSEKFTQNSTESKIKSSKDDEIIHHAENNETKAGNYEIIASTESNESDWDNYNQKINLSKHVTGQGRIIGIIAFVLLLCFVGIKYIRDE
jgi:hypothetical protein